MRRVMCGLAALAILGVGCESEFDPEIQSELVIRSTFIEYSQERAVEGIVPVLDGQANNIEWGSPDDPQRPYGYIQVSALNGFGNPGGSRFIAVKSAFTALWNPASNNGEGAWVLRNVYFLIRWADLSPSSFKDSFVYQGPNLAQRAPVLEAQISALYPELDADEVQEAVIDSLLPLMFDVDGNPLPENWIQDGGDDRMLILLGDGEATDSEGRKFKDFGFQVARNGPGFGPLASGFLDAWEWSASRTNPPLDATFSTDAGGDVEPIEGLSGYCFDQFIDASAPMQLDDGPVLLLPNFDTSLPEDQRVPGRVWIERTDPNRDNQSAGQCNAINLGMDFPWLHRAAVGGAVFTPDFDDPRLINQVVFNWDTRESERPRYWVPGDFVSGYLLGHDGLDRTNPERFQICQPACILAEGTPNCGGNDYCDAPHICNSIHVRAKGLWQGASRHWVVELTRSLGSQWGNTNTVGNAVEDLDFDGILDRPRDFYMTIAIWDDADDGGAYWGSPPIRLHFDPPPPPAEDVEE